MISPEYAASKGFKIFLVIFPVLILLYCLSVLILPRINFSEQEEIPDRLPVPKVEIHSSSDVVVNVADGMFAIIQWIETNSECKPIDYTETNDENSDEGKTILIELAIRNRGVLPLKITDITIKDDTQTVYTAQTTSSPQCADPVTSSNWPQSEIPAGYGEHFYITAKHLPLEAKGFVITIQTLYSQYYAYTDETTTGTTHIFYKLEEDRKNEPRITLDPVFFGPPSDVNMVENGTAIAGMSISVEDWHERTESSSNPQQAIVLLFKNIQKQVIELPFRSGIEAAVIDDYGVWTDVDFGDNPGYRNNIMPEEEQRYKIIADIETDSIIHHNSFWVYLSIPSLSEDIILIPVSTEQENTESLVNVLATPFPTLPACNPSMPTQLMLGVDAMVSLVPPVPNNVRTSAGKSSSLVGQIAPGTVMQVIDGPVCANGWYWWKIKADNGITGWTAEGGANEYWLLPAE